MLSKTLKGTILAMALGATGSMPAVAQTDAEKAIDRYREMVADGNPAELWEARGF